MQDFKERMEEYNKFESTSDSNIEISKESRRVPHKENYGLQCKIWTILIIIAIIGFLLKLLGVE